MSRLSVVVPVFDEKETLEELHRRVGAVLDRLSGGPHQLVLVDDGSSDGSAALLDDLARRSDRLLVVHLSRNFGHQAAIAAGIDHASGDWIAVMDGDLQDPPEEIPRLLEKALEGFDVVYARRVNRKEGWILRACYAASYRLIAGLSDIRIPLDSGDFAVLSRRVANALRATGERHLFLRGLRAWVGFRQCGLDVERRERHSGRSKFGFFRLLGLLFDGLLGFSAAPLRAAAGVGFFAILFTGGYLLYVLAERLLLGTSPRGFTALIAAIVFLAGVQLLFLGLIGEYLGRTFEQVKGRPLYLVESLVRSAAQEGDGAVRYPLSTMDRSPASQTPVEATLGAPRIDPPKALR